MYLYGGIVLERDQDKDLVIEMITFWSVFDLIALVGGFFFALKGFMACLVIGPVTKFAKKASLLSQLFMVADYSDD